MGKKKTGRTMSKLVRKAAPFTSVISMVPGIGPIAAPGLSMLAQTAKTNRPGGGQGWNTKSMLGAVAGGGIPGIPGLGAITGLFGGKAGTPSATVPGAPSRKGDIPGAPPAAGGFGAIFNLFRKKK